MGRGRAWVRTLSLSRVIVTLPRFKLGKDCFYDQACSSCGMQTTSIYGRTIRCLSPEAISSSSRLGYTCGTRRHIYKCDSGLLSELSSLLLILLTIAHSGAILWAKPSVREWWTWSIPSQPSHHPRGHESPSSFASVDHNILSAVPPCANLADLKHLGVRPSTIPLSMLNHRYHVNETFVSD